MKNFNLKASFSSFSSAATGAILDNKYGVSLTNTALFLAPLQAVGAWDFLSYGVVAFYSSTIAIDYLTLKVLSFMGKEIKVRHSCSEKDWASIEKDGFNFPHNEKKIEGENMGICLFQQGKDMVSFGAFQQGSYYEMSTFSAENRDMEEGGNGDVMMETREFSVPFSSVHRMQKTEAVYVSVSRGGTVNKMSFGDGTEVTIDRDIVNRMDLSSGKVVNPYTPMSKRSALLGKLLTWSAQNSLRFLIAYTRENK